MKINWKTSLNQILKQVDDYEDLPTITKCEYIQEILMGHGIYSLACKRGYCKFVSDEKTWKNYRQTRYRTINKY